MSELAQILALWHDAKKHGDQYVLATVVRVEGSSYRKPGARMLISSAGRRAGTISGGCLEAEVVRKAFWLTEQGPAIERYQSSFDEDGSAPFGLGCGGTIFILMERGASGDAVLLAMERSAGDRTASAIVTVIDVNSDLLSQRLILSERGDATGQLPGEPALSLVAASTIAERRSSWHTLTLAGRPSEVFAEYLPRAVSLLVFGAGDDAQPLVEAAAVLGWRVTVADGRANLVRRERFPSANLLFNLAIGDLPQGLDIVRADAAVVMSHSYEQDRAALHALLQSAIPYIGVLGPRNRTVQLVADVASATGIDPEQSMQRLRSPVGLDLGGDNPASIALSIVAEILSVFRARSGASLSAQRTNVPIAIPA